MNRIVIHIALLLIGFSAYSQGEILFDTSTSTINSDEILVEKAPRIYSQAKSDLNLMDTVNRTIDFDFDYTPNVNLSPLKTTVAIYRLKIKQEDNSRAGLIRAGAGNYGTSLLDVYYGSRANDKWAYGIGYNHLASLNGNVEKRESGFSDNGIKAHTKYFTNNSIINADIFYDRRLVRNYGYLGAVEEYGNLSSTPTVDSAFTYEQSLVLPSHKIGGTISLETNENKKLSTIVFLSPTFLKVNDALNTFNFSAKMQPVYRLKWGDLRVPIIWDINNHNAETVERRNLVSFSPTISHLSEDERLNIQAGIKTNVSNDTTLNKRVHVYPLIKGSYLLSKEKKIVVSSELTGGINQFNLLDIYAQNPFITRAYVASSNNKITINTSLDYSPLANLNLKAYFNYSFVENFGFFTPDTLDLSFYTPDYASSPVTIVTPGLTASYESKKGHKIKLNTQFSNFSTENNQVLYYTPKSRTELGLNYKVNQKIRISSDISYISGIVGLNPIENTEYELDNILDLNIGVNYKFNDKLGAFLYGNNLLNKKYEFYRFYTVNGINVLGGLTYSF